MSDTNQLLLLLAAAQQQQQQQAMLAKIQKAANAVAATANSASRGTTATASESQSPARNGASASASGSASGAGAGAGLQNVALAQQLTQLAQIGALLAAQKKQQQQPAPTPKASTSSSSSTPSAAGMTPEMMMMWQQAFQMQALQQMMMTPQKNQMEEAIKKMMEMAKKKPTTTTSSSQGASGSQGTSGASGGSGTSGTSGNQNPAQNQMMNSVMWQLVAQQMQQKQQQQHKESQKKAEQVKKAKEAAKQQQKEQEAKTRQQEEIVKFLMAQHQLNHQKKHQKKQEEAAALAAVLAAKAAAAAAAGDGSEENGKKLSEAMLRLPLQLGWRRQTCVRMMTASGVRGDVSYFAPCGKKLGTYSEVVRYLSKNGINYINRDNFAFTTKMVIGEFIVPRPAETDDNRQEREFAVLSEDDINKELIRLNALKSVPKSAAVNLNSGDEEVVKSEPPVTKASDEPEEPLDPAELNDEFHEDVTIQMTTSSDECKIRERELDDLLVNDNRHLPEFTPIGNQCLSSQGFADALMVHEFVQNFGHVLGIDLETTPKLEILCAGLAGDAEKSDLVLQLTRKLLRLALEFPGMGNEKRFGQGGGEMGLDRENFSEVMRLFLVDKGKRGEELSTPLQTCNFLCLRAEQKASILAFLCDELVCSRNVVQEIDRNLDEISRLRGEKWMREGKARALKSARSNKRKLEASAQVVAVQQQEQQHHESDSEPPTRPVTPKKSAQVVMISTITSSPIPSSLSSSQKKFTPGLGQCEVLTEQEESMSQEQMEVLIGDLQQEAVNINQKIHDTTLRIRSFPFGTDRFHRNYWLLAHTDAVLVESISSSAQNNPACNVHEIASKDPPLLEERVGLSADDGRVENDVLVVLEELVDEVVLQRAKADRKMRKRYRRVENAVKRGWWTIPNRETIESLRTALLGRGIRERALHRLLTKPWFINDLKLGTITLDPVGPSPDLELLGRQGWIRLSKAIDKLQSHLKMSDVAKPEFSLETKPLVVPTSMALAQIVKDEDVEWKVVEDADVADTVDVDLEFVEAIRQRIVDTADMVDPKFWRPKFRALEALDSDEAQELDSESPEFQVQGQDPLESELFLSWKQYVLHESVTSSQLMVALQALEGMIMWERSAREALCQICKSMDGDEMLVCDGCESGCHMECFRPRMMKVPEGDWFCQRCREEKTGKSICMFCSKESGTMYKCQRCAYHMHQDCAQDDKKETIRAETFICPHCQEMKQMRFVKRVMLRGESEERDEEEEKEKEKEEQKKDKDSAGTNGTPRGHVENQTQNGGVKMNLKRKMEPSSVGGLPLSMNKELCQLMLDELGGQTNALPFLEPVNPKQVPGYKMIIAKPMDLGTIRTKNGKELYETPEDFAEDIELMFANCRQFNIDHSEIGRAGINLHKFFQKRWKQLKYNFTKRLRRLHRHS